MAIKMTDEKILEVLKRLKPDGYPADTSPHLMDKLRDLSLPYGFKPMLCGPEDPGADETIIFRTDSGYRSTISIDIPRYESGRIDAIVRVIDTVTTELMDDWSHVLFLGNRQINDEVLKKTDEVMDRVTTIIAEQGGFGIDPFNLPASATVVTNPRTLEIFQSVSKLDTKMIRVLGGHGGQERIDVDFGKEHGMLHVEIVDTNATVRVRARSKKFSFEDYSPGSLGEVISGTLVEMNRATRALRY